MARIRTREAQFRRRQGGFAEVAWRKDLLVATPNVDRYVRLSPSGTRLLVVTTSSCDGAETSIKELRRTAPWLIDSRGRTAAESLSAAWTELLGAYPTI